MREQGGFIDLRVDRNAQAIGDDSVWPSFTDIMTVIVMIFLMALVVIMARNFELDRQLLSSLSAQEESLLENRSLSAELAALKRQLAELTAQRNLLRAESARLAEEKSALAANLQRAQDAGAALGEKVASLETRETELRGEVSALTESSRALSAQLSASALQLEQTAAALRAERETSAARLAQSDAEIARLTESIRARQAENIALQQRAEQSAQKSRSLQQEYDALDAKFRKLVRPARTAAGKHVVEVLIDKSGDGYRFRIKEPGQRVPTWVSRAALERRLDQLKTEKGLQLYTKIIIPPGSNLLHNEAWRLTNEILRAYDYYYREYPQAPAE